MTYNYIWGILHIKIYVLRINLQLNSRETLLENVRWLALVNKLLDLGVEVPMQSDE